MSTIQVNSLHRLEQASFTQSTSVIELNRTERLSKHFRSVKQIKQFNDLLFYAAAMQDQPSYPRPSIYNEAIIQPKLTITKLHPKSCIFINLMVYRVASNAAVNGTTRRLLPLCKLDCMTVGVNPSLHLRNTLFISLGMPSSTTDENGTIGRSSIPAAKIPYS